MMMAFVRNVLVPYTCGVIAGLMIGFAWGNMAGMNWYRGMTRRVIDDAFKKMAGGQHGE